LAVASQAGDDVWPDVALTKRTPKYGLCPDWPAYRLPAASAARPARLTKDAAVPMPSLRAALPASPASVVTMAVHARALAVTDDEAAEVLVALADAATEEDLLADALVLTVTDATAVLVLLSDSDGEGENDGNGDGDGDGEGEGEGKGEGNGDGSGDGNCDSDGDGDSDSAGGSEADGEGDGVDEGDGVNEGGGCALPPVQSLGCKHELHVPNVDEQMLLPGVVDA
jgi:hypothetical protein